MPQLNKGGKFVFGLSVIHENRSNSPASYQRVSLK